MGWVIFGLYVIYQIIMVAFYEYWKGNDNDRK